MHIHRKTLYLGVFLLTAAAVMLVGQAGGLDIDVVARALELWPLVFIAIGAALLLRRTRFGLATGVVAAVIPGLLLGGVTLAAPTLDFNCGQSQATTYSTLDGTFGDVATVELDLSCGELTVDTRPGSGWVARTADGSGYSIDSSARHLRVNSVDRNFRFGRPWGAEVWQITLPTDALIDLSAQLNAGEGDLKLNGARLRALALDVNAGDVRVDLTGALLDSLAMDLNAGSATVRLPAGDNFSSRFTVNAGSLGICVPSDLGVRIQEEGELASTSFPGFLRTANGWETPNYATETNHADVTISVNVGSVEIDPEGDCK